jgi:hypothetical protein
MSRAEVLLNSVINLVSEEFCEVDESDCDTCVHYDSGNCPILLSKQYLEDEGYLEDDE